MVRTARTPLLVDTDPRVERAFSACPASARRSLRQLRSLILDTAAEAGIERVEETLKWGEPSYLVKGGSTIRIAWKPNTPDACYLFFNCNTRLVATFRELYGQTFVFAGNRALVFEQGRDIPTEELKHCVQLALTYHSVKHLPLLGA